MLAVGETAFGTGGGLAGIGDLGVPQGGNGGLSCRDLAAPGAMLAVGETAFGTGGGLAGIGDLGVPQGGNGGLS